MTVAAAGTHGSTGESPDSFHRAEASQQSNPRKLWQVWPGQHMFLRDGRIMVPKTWMGAVRTILLILVLEGGLLGFVAPRLDYPLDIAGIVTGERDITVGEAQVVLRYDEMYHMYRPPRAHHCRVLDVVIARFDHHCPWTGNTIGLRNYRHFMLFLISCFLTLVHAVTVCVIHVVQYISSDRDNSSPSSNLRLLGTPIILLFTVAFTLAVGCLLGFHLYLIARGMTTYESLERRNVFSEGCSQNCHNVWCQPIPAPFVDFSISVDDVSLSPPPLIRMYNPQCCQEGPGNRDEPALQA